MSIKDTITPAEQADPAPHQQPPCASAYLMRHANQVRSTYFANVRRDVIAASGEIES